MRDQKSLVFHAQIPACYVYDILKVVDKVHLVSLQPPSLICSAAFLQVVRYDRHWLVCAASSRGGRIVDW